MLPVRPGIKTTIDGVVFTDFPATKKSSARIQGQNTVGPFFDNKGIINKEFVPASQPINGPFYHAILNRLLQRIRRVRPQLHRTAKCMLLYDNVPAHGAIRVRQFLAMTIVAVFDHPPYSLIWLLRTSSFPALGRPSKVHFCGRECHQRSVTVILRSTPQEVFSHCFRKLYERCKMCVVAMATILRGNKENLFVIFVLLVFG